MTKQSQNQNPPENTNDGANTPRVLTVSAFADLSKTKSGMSVSDDGIIIDGVEIPLDKKVLNRAIVEGIYRLMGAESAKEKDKPKTCLDIISRLRKGYWTATEEKKAAQTVVEKTGGAAKLKFTRTEIMAEIRASVPKKELPALEEKLKVVTEYSDETFLLFVNKQLENKESLVSKAIATLTERTEEKAKKELEAKLADLIDL